MNLFDFFYYFILLTVLLLAGNEGSSYFETYFDSPVDSLNRNALKMDNYKWPTGVVYYEFDSTYEEKDQTAVINSFKTFHEETCVRFEPNNNENRTRIKFIKSKGCGSSIGYRPKQVDPILVAYSDYCLTVPGAIQHELFHVLGLFHEQCRPDRDDYIKVIWENVDPQFRQNFIKGNDEYMETFGLPYDFKSLMHYPRHAFARRGAQYTMVARNNTEMELGQSDGPTFLDLEKVRRMYKCGNGS